MMKRIARAVLVIRPPDAIAMLKETSLASGMEMDIIDAHVILIIVSKFVVLRLRLNDVMHYMLDVGKKQKLNQTLFRNKRASTELLYLNKKFSK